MKKVIKFTLILIIADVLICILYYSEVKKFIDNPERIENPEAVIVFFGDYDERNHCLLEISIQRLDHAIKLYDSLNCKSIVCVGGNRPGRHIKGSKISCDYLIKRGIDPEVLFFDTLSFDTKTNWIEAKKIVKQNNFSKIICVSSPLHIYRISKIACEHDVYYSTFTINHSNIVDYFNLFININKELFVWILYTLIPEKTYIKLLKCFR